MEIIKKYLIYIAVLVLIVIFALYLLIPIASGIVQKIPQIDEKKANVENLTKELELAKKAKMEKENALSEGRVIKQIYESDIKSTDMMVNFNGMLETVLNLAKQAGLKTKTIEFKVIPEADLVKQNHSNDYDATLLIAQMYGTYTELQNFLREVYRHEYLMGIYELKITPYEADKKILIINISLSLYSKK